MMCIQKIHEKRPLNPSKGTESECKRNEVAMGFDPDYAIEVVYRVWKSMFPRQSNKRGALPAKSREREILAQRLAASIG